MIISLSEYNNSLDKVENQFISSSAAELTKEEFAKQIRILLERATATGVHLANREVKKLESRKIKKFSERVSQSFKWDITDEEIRAGKGMIDRAGEFWDEYSLKIAGDWEKDKIDKTANIMQNIAKEEYTQKELQKKISEELGMWNMRRVEMIARTETTKMFNFGRIETFRENAKNGGVTKAVKFSSILDERVTEICRSRHGLVLALDDPRIDENTPPLHINCRSILLPVPVWEFDEEYNNKSSDRWGKVEKVDETWGNAFAYGGIKSDYTGTISETAMKKTVINIENEIREEKLENGVAVNYKGKIIDKSIGSTQRIDYSLEELENFLNEGVRVYTHNHPKDSFFSADDVSLMVLNNFKEMRAVGKENTFVLKIPQNWGYKDEKGMEIINRYVESAKNKDFEKAKENAKLIQKSITRDWSELCENNKELYNSNRDKFYHNVMQELAEMYNLDFKMFKEKHELKFNDTPATANDETYEEFMKRHEKPEFVIHWEGKKE